MFINIRLTHHVLGIIMPIIRRTDCIKLRVVLARMCWLRLCGVRTWAERTVSALSSCPDPTQHLYLCHQLVLSSPTLMMHGHTNLKLTVTVCRCFAKCLGMCSVIYPICVMTIQILTDLTISVVTNGKWWVFYV